MFLASQDAIEVMSVTERVSVSIDFTDVTLIVWHFEEAANGTFGDPAPTAQKG